MTILPQTGAAQASQTRIAKVKKAATFIGKRLGDRASKAILKSAAADSKKRRNRQTLWGGCTDANPKLLLNDT